MLSMPPATATSASPARISAAASMIALSPEPQTRLIVVALVVDGQAGLERGLAGRRLADPGLEDLAHEDLVDRPCPRAARSARPRPGSRRRRAPWPARSSRPPPNLPIGVRAALTR